MLRLSGICPKSAAEQTSSGLSTRSSRFGTEEIAERVLLWLSTLLRLLGVTEQTAARSASTEEAGSWLLGVLRTED